MTDPLTLHDNGTCYRLFNHRQTYESATDQCRANYGGLLTNLVDRELMLKMKSRWSPEAVAPFLGPQISGLKTWDDFTDVDVEWNTVQADYGDDCSMIFFEKEGKHDVNCTQVRQAICEENVSEELKQCGNLTLRDGMTATYSDGHTVVNIQCTCTNETFVGHCVGKELGWYFDQSPGCHLSAGMRHYQGKCFKLVEEKVTYLQATDTCKTEYQGLLAIPPDFEFLGLWPPRGHGDVIYFGPQVTDVPDAYECTSKSECRPIWSSKRMKENLWGDQKPSDTATRQCSCRMGTETKNTVLLRDVDCNYPAVSVCELNVEESRKSKR